MWHTRPQFQWGSVVFGSQFMVVPRFLEKTQMLLNMWQEYPMERIEVYLTVWVQETVPFKSREHAVEQVQNISKDIPPQTLNPVEIDKQSLTGYTTRSPAQINMIAQ